jgi:signal recognition particle receptor subunit beta
MANEIKIVIVGNVGSGKTTSISTISEIPVVGTEASASEQDALRRKKTTTVAMEYGITNIDEVKIHLYGSPGQRRFEFMADLLLEGAAGLIVMIDNGSNDPLSELDYYLKRHNSFLKKNPAIIGITHFDDLKTQTSLLDYHFYTIQNQLPCPVMRLDARKKNDVEKTIKRLLIEISRNNEKIENA